eukprot:m.27055 g.27055  ORF g.27055 m.27055 type:complete len:517 (-) comp15658_c1_seq1:111-1661(-)
MGDQPPDNAHLVSEAQGRKRQRTGQPPTNYATINYAAFNPASPNSAKVHPPTGSPSKSSPTKSPPIQGFLPSPGTALPSVDEVETPFTMVFGGCGMDFARLDSCEAYNYNTNSWTMLPPMCTRRAFTTSTYLMKKVFVFGGHDGACSLKTIECFDPDTATWKLVKPMLRERAGAHVVPIDDHTVLIVGGDRSAKFSDYDSIEKYNVETGASELLDTKFVARDSAAIAVLDDWIYVSGGISKWLRTNPIATMDRYNYKLNTWQAVPSMSKGRCTHSMYAYDNKLWCFSGHDGNVELSDVFTFDPVLEEYTALDTALTLPRPMAIIDKTPKGSNFILVGGVNPQSMKRSTCEVYNTETLTFRSIAPMSIERACCGIASFTFSKNPNGTFPWEGVHVLPTLTSVDTESHSPSSEQFAYCTRDQRCPKPNRHAGRCKIGRATFGESLTPQTQPSTKNDNNNISSGSGNSKDPTTTTTKTTTTITKAITVANDINGNININTNNTNTNEIITTDVNPDTSL